LQRPPEGIPLYDSYLRKGQSVTLEQNFTLVAHYLECTIPEPFWRECTGIQADYRLSVDSAHDCNTRRYRLIWEAKVVRRALREHRPVVDRRGPQ